MKLITSELILQTSQFASQTFELTIPHDDIIFKLFEYTNQIPHEISTDFIFEFLIVSNN